MSTQLTIAQIAKFGDALANCSKTSLTWDEAKPYLIRHVEETGRPFQLDFPEMVEVNNCALGLRLDEVNALVTITYGMVFDTPMTLFATPRVPLQEGVLMLQQWARKTGAVQCSPTLTRIGAWVKPVHSLVLFYRFASGDTESVFDNIFEFNRAVREYAGKLRRAEIVDSMFEVTGKNGSHHILRLGEVPLNFMREFCDLVNKFI